MQRPIVLLELICSVDNRTPLLSDDNYHAPIQHIASVILRFPEDRPSESIE